MEIRGTPERGVGSATLADPKKAQKAIEAILDYLVKLHDDILEAFPPGKLPEAHLMSERPQEEIEKVLKGPLNGGISIYALE
jgi:creatinine amidohydrolase